MDSQKEVLASYISATEAKCTAQEECSYTWTPNKAHSNYQLILNQNVTNAAGYSGAFTVSPAPLPVIKAVAPNPARLDGSLLTISGSNFDPVGAYSGIGWFTHSHVIVYAQNENGEKGVLWEGGSQGGKTSSSTEIMAPLGSPICMLSEVGLGGCPPGKKMSLESGPVSLTVWVDGRGESASVPLTIEGPKITSVTPSSGPVGTVVELKGKSFSGFEGDKYAWIENSKGEKGIIYGDTKVATDSYIKFTLASKYCTADTSYSGNPCPSYISITPGAYKIYVMPWGTLSNKVTFTVSS